MAEGSKQSQNGRLSALDLTRSARDTVLELTGYKPESVSAMQWDGETWLVTVDVCELERIPNTTDVMGTYVVQLDDGGGLLGYKRTRRYTRGSAEEGGPAWRALRTCQARARERCRGTPTRRRTWPTSSSAFSTRGSSSRATSRSTCSTSSC